MKRHPHAILALLCLAQLMLVLDFSIVNVALPSIGHELGLSGQRLQWVITAYALTFGGFLMVGGRAADLVGRREMLISGLTVFTLASLFGGYSTEAWHLIGARALQGLGAAATAPAIVSLITATFAEGAPRHWAMGWLGTMGTIGFAVGMVLGGFLTSELGWEWVMFVNVPAGVLIAIAAWMLLPRGGEPEGRKGVDMLGAAAVTGAATALVFSISQASANGWSDRVTLIALGLAIIQAGIFIVAERRLVDPLVPRSFFRNRALVGANLVAFLLAAASPSMVFMLTLYMQQTLKFSAMATGLAFLPQATMAFTATRFVSKLVGRFGPRTVVLAGCSLLSVGLLTYVPLSATSDYGTGILPGMLIAPVGSLLGFIAAMIIATSGVPQFEQGLAAGMLTTSQQLGAAIGLSLVASTLGRSEAEAGGASTALLVSLPTGFLLTAMFALAAFLTAATMLKPTRLKPATLEPTALNSAHPIAVE